MNFKNIFKPFFIIILIGAGLWLYIDYKNIPDLPVYKNDVINEQGQTVKIEDLKGDYILVSYFQTWCGDCIKELPGIDHLQSKVGQSKLKVVMISDEDWGKINRFKEKHCNTLNFYQSIKKLPEQGIHVFPTTYLLNKEGVVIMTKQEGYNWDSDEVINKCVD
jgi:peroxiredoxin